MFVIFSRRLYCKIHNWSRPKLDVLRHFWWSNQGFYSPTIHTGHFIAFDTLISRKQHQNEKVQCTQITQKQHVQKRELLFNRHGKYCIRQCNTLPAHFSVQFFFSFFCLITLCQSSRVFVCKLKEISKQIKKCVQFWQAGSVCVCARVCIRTHMCQNIPQTLNDMFSNSANVTRVLYVNKNRMSYGTQLAGVFFFTTGVSSILNYVQIITIYFSNNNQYFEKNIHISSFELSWFDLIWIELSLVHSTFTIQQYFEPDIFVRA